MTAAQPTPDEITFARNVDLSRYEASLGDRVVALAEYRATDTQIDFTHTETDDDCAGRGIASGLVRFALDDVLAMRPVPKVVATCPFVAHVIAENPAYESLREV